jgi:general secretion pathway protein G
MKLTWKSRRQSQRGMTLLEIMIVIAILGLVMGLVVVPKVIGHSVHAKVRITKLAVDQYAYQTYPQWSLANPAAECPSGVLELATFAGKPESDTRDPWNTPYRMFCGADRPTEVSHGIGVASRGGDRVEHTEDDIHSW